MYFCASESESRSPHAFIAAGMSISAGFGPLLAELHRPCHRLSSPRPTMPPTSTVSDSVEYAHSATSYPVEESIMDEPETNQGPGPERSEHRDSAIRLERVAHNKATGIGIAGDDPNTIQSPPDARSGSVALSDDHVSSNGQHQTSSYVRRHLDGHWRSEPVLVTTFAVTQWLRLKEPNQEHGKALRRGAQPENHAEGRDVPAPYQLDPDPDLEEEETVMSLLACMPATARSRSIVSQSAEVASAYTPSTVSSAPLAETESTPLTSTSQQYGPMSEPASDSSISRPSSPTISQASSSELSEDDAYNEYTPEEDPVDVSSSGDSGKAQGTREVGKVKNRSDQAARNVASGSMMTRSRSRKAGAGHATTRAKTGSRVRVPRAKPQSAHSAPKRDNTPRNLLHCKYVDCDYSFLASRDLKRHEATHTGEDRWRCLRCQKILARHDSALRHSRRHEGRPLLERVEAAEE
ncbi:uncharacterized protein B0H18DRAFT_1013107 [Fomitopsis serialis]|uniref:uncharacterized protein n=1 Tax=Fomitopsis serialis TaxID=139415 RepID=UPI0020089721|nr:uncharacterized protein B0H18DRAFT_1013107 [Neoantrodia serialis]KAH9924031.1 hypothetical protein B0H18DRAFT_1013107 [Neoantrodia serialis]